MPPEMFRQSRRETEVDTYSLGCLLFGRKRGWEDLDGPEVILGSYGTLPEGPSVDHLTPNLQQLCSNLIVLCSLECPSGKEVIRMIDNWAL